MILPIILLLLVCQQVTVEKRPLRHIRTPVPDYLVHQARRRILGPAMLNAFLFLGLFLQDTHRIQMQVKRVVLGRGERAIKARQAARARAGKLLKALRLHGGAMSWGLRARVGARYLGAMVLLLLGLGGPQGGPAGPNGGDIIDYGRGGGGPTGPRPGPATSVIPGVIDGKWHEVPEDPELKGGKRVITWESKHAHTHFGEDGSANYHIDRPYMAPTGKLDKEGKEVQEKRYEAFWWRLTPFLKLQEHKVMPAEKDAVIDHETRKRDKVLEYITKTVDVVMPKGDIVKQEVKEPVYELEEVDGPMGPVEQRVQEEYVHYIHGDKPAELQDQFSGGISIKTVIGKTKVKETITLQEPRDVIIYGCEDSGNIRYEVQADPDAPGYGDIVLKDQFGKDLGARIPAPSGHDSDKAEIPCHWEMIAGYLYLLIDEDLASPKPVKTYYIREEKKDKAGKAVLDEDGLPIEVEVEKVEYHTWKAPFTLDPSVTWDGTKIEISGNGNTLGSMKTLYEEGFNNIADGTALDTYDANWTVTKAGTSVAEIDTAQYYTGNSSLLIHMDGANKVSTKKVVAHYDYTRYTFRVRSDSTTDEFNFCLLDSTGTNYLLYFRVDDDGFIRAYQGNGSGGAQNITCKAYVANTWYKLMVDVDVTNDKCRIWVDDVLYPGSNANAGGWDRFFSDQTTTYVGKMEFYSEVGAGNIWIDDITIELGDEIYAHGNLPYNPNEISESLSPTGTLSGMDGDWGRSGGVSIAIDNTRSIIGTNSIKLDDADYEHYAAYVLDTALDVTNYSQFSVYVWPETMTTIKIYMVSSAGNWYWKTFNVVADHWNIIDFSISDWTGWTTVGTPNMSAFKEIYIMNYQAASNDLDMYIECPHFYGARNGRGAHWSSQSIQTQLYTATQLNRSVPSPARNHKLNEKNANWISCNSLEANGLDYSGKGHDFTVSSAPAPEGNPIYGGTHTRMNFDGADDEYHITTDDFLTTSGALAIWIEPDTIAAGTDSIWCIWAADNDRVYLRRNGAALELVHNIDAATTTYWLGTLIAERAYNCVWNWDGTNWIFTLDGKTVLSLANSKTPNNIASGATTYIGCHKSGGATADFWDGHIWDFQFYNSNSGLDLNSRALLAGAGKDLYIDDSKEIRVNASGARYNLGHRFPEEPNALCEATTGWTETSHGSPVTSIGDAVYGTKSVRVTRIDTNQLTPDYGQWMPAAFNLQKLAGAKTTIAKTGKVVFHMRTSGSETVNNLIIHTWPGNGFIYSTPFVTTPYWKKYELNLKDFTVWIGSPDWSNVAWEIFFVVNGGAIGGTIDINDLHFEERTNTNRSTTSGYYDNILNDSVNENYYEYNYAQTGFSIGGGTNYFCHGTINNTPYWGFDIYGNTTTTIDDFIGNTTFSPIGLAYTSSTFYFNRLQISGQSYNDLYSNVPNLIITNSVLSQIYTGNQFTSLISYNHNNVQGSHKIWGNVPLSAATVSDFPRSRTRITSSSKGWSSSGSATVEGTQNGSLFLTNGDGADVDIHASTALCCPIDIGPQADANHPNNFKMKWKSQGFDAQWTLRITLANEAAFTNYHYWQVGPLANDFDETRTVDISGAPDGTGGAFDHTAVTYLKVEFLDVATGAEKVRAWIDEIYLETDAGKVMFEQGAAVAAYKVTVGAATTKVIDNGVTWTWDDTAGAGYDSTSTGALLFLGTAGSPIVMTSAAAPPTNYWAMTFNMNLTADYTTWRYHSGIAIGTGTWDVDNCTSDRAIATEWSIIMAAGCTITSFTNIVISNCVYGLSSSKAYAAFDNIVLTAVSGTQVYAGNVKLEFVNSNFDAANCNCAATGVIYSRTHNDVANAFVVVLADGDTQAFASITNEPAATDNMAVYLETGGTAATFNFDEAAKTLASITIQTGKTVTTGFTSSSTFAINGSFVNAYIINVTGTTQVTHSAVAGAADVYFQFLSNANCTITIAAGAKYILVGSAAYRVYLYEALRLSVAGNGVITDSGPANSIGISGGTLQATYSHIFHMRNLLKSSTLTLTDSEYWFTPAGAAPVEEIVAATWTLLRSLVSSYSSKLWYVKPTGTLSLTNSFLDHCLPTIYSNNYYIVWFHMPNKITPTPAAKVLAEDVYLGSVGEYQEHIAYKSEGQTVEGRVTYDDLALWDHALDHRIFVARMNELLLDQDEFPKFTWHQGHYPKCELQDFKFQDQAGEDFNVSSRTYKATITRRPYN